VAARAVQCAVAYKSRHHCPCKWTNVRLTEDCISASQALLTEAPGRVAAQDLAEAAAPLIAMCRSGSLPQRGAAAAALQVPGWLCCILCCDL
jgi:hypothetical protein